MILGVVVNESAPIISLTVVENHVIVPLADVDLFSHSLYQAQLMFSGYAKSNARQNQLDFHEILHLRSHKRSKFKNTKKIWGQTPHFSDRD